MYWVFHELRVVLDPRSMPPVRFPEILSSYRGYSTSAGGSLVRLIKVSHDRPTWAQLVSDRWYPSIDSRQCRDDTAALGCGCGWANTKDDTRGLHIKL